LQRLLRLKSMELLLSTKDWLSNDLSSNTGRETDFSWSSPAYDEGKSGIVVVFWKTATAVVWLGFTYAIT